MMGTRRGGLKVKAKSQYWAKLPAWRVEQFFSFINSPTGRESCFYANFTSNLKHLLLQKVNDSLKIFTCDGSRKTLFEQYS